MGPNPLRLLEELCQHLDLKPGMKVLDMGCGKGLTSVFLANEYGVTVLLPTCGYPQPGICGVSSKQA